jgi:hypothetical protein
MVTWIVFSLGNFRIARYLHLTLYPTLEVKTITMKMSDKHTETEFS